MASASEQGGNRRPTPRTTGKPAGSGKPAPNRKPAVVRKPAARPKPGKATSSDAPPNEQRTLAPDTADVVTDAAATTEVAEVPGLDVVEADVVEIDVAEPDVAEAESEVVEAEVAEAEVVEAEPERVEVEQPSEAERAPARAPVKRTPPRRATAKQRSKKRDAPAARGKRPELVLSVDGLTKRFDETVAVDGIDLEVRAGWFTGIVGPNGAGKTTTLSMITGLLRPDSGNVVVHGADVWSDPDAAKRQMGVLPDRLRLFDRLTGNQLLYYSGVLRGLDAKTVRERIADLAATLGLEDALGRLVTDYSAGMTKKIALAAAMIHSPRLLVLDEPFESVDPVSAATVIEILERYVAAGGTVLLSSHSMDLVQRICDHVAVIVGGRILAKGTMDEVRDGASLEERFVELAGGRRAVGGLEWLHTFSD